MAGALNEIKEFIEGLRDGGVEAVIESSGKAEALKWKAEAIKYRMQLVSVLNMLSAHDSTVNRLGGLSEEEKAVVMKAWLSIDGDI
jgi:hypothetical protein